MQKGYGIFQKSNNLLLYSSRDTRYKKPFGAVATDQKIEINFPIKNNFQASGVVLILRKGEETKKYPLALIGQENGYDIYNTIFAINETGTYFYRFEILKENSLCFVGKSTNGKAKLKDWLPEWQLSVYDKNYKTPSIHNGNIIYHIFIDRFCKKNQTRRPKYGTYKEWQENITVADNTGVYRADDFYGGNFQGIISKLDYFASLGISMLYLSPIFESISNHRYDTGDYSKVDYLLGDEEDFQELIDKASQRGIGIMLDGVFNHTGADSKYFNKFNHYPTLGAYQSKDSPYYDWYTFTEFPNKYECWWGITCVPTVSKNAQGYQEMIAGNNGILQQRTKQGIIGWRLDVVDELSSSFVEKIRSAIKDTNEDTLVIGEVWEDASTKFSYGEEREYFRSKQLDGVMNYPFRNAIIDYLNHHNSSKFIEEIMSICENYPLQSLNCCMTILGSHDTVRIINKLAQINTHNTTKEQRRDYVISEKLYSKAVKKLKIASALQYFLPGMPTVYYGDEIGMEGFEDPINRRPFDLNKANQDVLEHYKKLGALRTNNKSIFLDLFDYIKTDKDVVLIKRGGFLLIANATKHRYLLNKEYTDYLSNNVIAEVDALTAAIVLCEND